MPAWSRPALERLGSASSPWFAASPPSWLPFEAAVVVSRAPRSQLDDLVALARARAALPKTLACLAVSGTDFHGQSGKPWVTLSGNLHLSLWVTIDRALDHAGATLTALPAVAVLDALDEHLPEPGGIKWVNDVLVAGKKVAGVLSHTAAQGPRTVYAVWGIGLNVETKPEMASIPSVPEATFVAEHAPSVTLADLNRSVLLALSRRLRQVLDDRGASIIEDYRQRSAVIGRQVEIRDDRTVGGFGVCQGRVEGMSDRLELHLSGQPEPIGRGRLILLPEDELSLEARRR